MDMHNLVQQLTQFNQSFGESSKKTPNIRQQHTTTHTAALC
jgi:hypothetical protein